MTTELKTIKVRYEIRVRDEALKIGAEIYPNEAGKTGYPSSEHYKFMVPAARRVLAAQCEAIRYAASQFCGAEVSDEYFIDMGLMPETEEFKFNSYKIKTH